MEKTNYDILVRKDGEKKYAAFCPQLNILVKGTSHEEVEMEVRKRIKEYLEQKNEEIEYETSVYGSDKT
jgi:predicted RNase H-like HicB family nuclease